MSVTRLSALIAVAALAVAVFAVARLEAVRGSVEIEHLRFGETPVSVYRGRGPVSAGSPAEPSLVVVSHGFAGSRQMMEAISLSLARSGHVVVAFDYLGHGRHRGALSSDINSLAGATEDLVRQTLDVVQEARRLTGADEVSLLGHSMATDVVVRAAARLPEIGSIVAISMYSEAVTATHPKRLLIVSGAQETRLREVALDAIAQIGPRAEAETAARGGAERRAVAAPWVGHVGVLWSSAALHEIALWLGGVPQPASTGSMIAALLLSLLVIFWSAAALLPKPPLPPDTSVPTLRRAVLASLLAAPLAFGGGVTGLPALGLAGFGALALCFAAYGLAALAILRPRLRVSKPDAIAALALLVWGLGLFAFAMDRYAAAFLPTGPRLLLMALLLPAMMVFAIADRAMLQGRHPLVRLLLRLPFLTALLGSMIAAQETMAMVFTVLPVLVLFFAVYGTLAAVAASRGGGSIGVGAASGVILAWALAASTPMFSAA